MGETARADSLARAPRSSDNTASSLPGPLPLDGLNTMPHAKLDLSLRSLPRRRLKGACVAAGLLIAIAGATLTAAQLPTGPLKAGVQVPVFEGLDDSGKVWRSTDHVGSKVLVVYFYQGDFSSTAIKQAKQFKADLEELAGSDVELVGVSGDSVASHALFKQTHQLNHTLLSDETGKIAKQFGVRVGEGGTVRNPAGSGTIRRKVTLGTRVFAIDLEGRIATSTSRISRLADIDAVFEQLAKGFWANQQSKEPKWIPTLDRHWKRLLSREQYLVTRRHQTERAFSGKYHNTKTPGGYRCIGCGQVLFQSGTKFKSGTGWPSFWNPASKECIEYTRDRSAGMVRTEVKCSRCDAHLGHVFSDGPPPTGHRYCINSAAIVLDTTAVDDNSRPRSR